MNKTISFNRSKMQIKFRVFRNDGKMLFSSTQYSAADEFCWSYDGPGELEIKKVWIPK